MIMITVGFLNVGFPCARFRMGTLSDVVAICACERCRAILRFVVLRVGVVCFLSRPSSFVGLGPTIIVVVKCRYVVGNLQLVGSVCLLMLTVQEDVWYGNIVNNSYQA